MRQVGTCRRESVAVGVGRLLSQNPHEDEDDCDENDESDPENDVEGVQTLEFEVKAYRVNSCLPVQRNVSGYLVMQFGSRARCSRPLCFQEASYRLQSDRRRNASEVPMNVGPWGRLAALSVFENLRGCSFGSLSTTA